MNISSPISSFSILSLEIRAKLEASQASAVPKVQTKKIGGNIKSLTRRVFLGICLF